MYFVHKIVNTNLYHNSLSVDVRIRTYLILLVKLDVKFNLNTTPLNQKITIKKNEEKSQLIFEEENNRIFNNLYTLKFVAIQFTFALMRNTCFL